MVELRTPQEIEALAKSNQVVAEVLQILKGRVEPGISTLELDRLAESEVRKRGARPAFKGYRGFPATICASLNEELVHGIPSAQRRLAEGDLLSIDLGVEMSGYYGDAAVTLPVGRVSPRAQRLMEVTEKALYVGIEQAREGNRVHDISAAIQRTVEAAGYSVVRDFVGHGIGTKLHEEPQIPNYGRPGTGLPLQSGMVLALEPMVNEGAPGVKVLADGWTAVTEDGQLCAHFEHTVVVGGDRPRILSQR